MNLSTWAIPPCKHRKGLSIKNCLGGKGMLKRQSKLLSIALILVFCMSLMFACFANQQIATAANMYQVIRANTVEPTGVQDIGVVKITLPYTTIANGSILTVSMPSDWTFPNNGGVVPVSISPAIAPDNRVAIFAPGSDAPGNDAPLGTGAFAAGSFIINPNNTFDIQMADTIIGNDVGANRYFYIYFYGIDPNNVAGDLKVTFLAPSGSAFETALEVTIGKSISKGETTAIIKTVKEITGDDTLDILVVMERNARTINNKGTIDLKILTKGFKWDSAYINDGKTKLLTQKWAVATYGWAWDGSAPLTFTAWTSPPDPMTIPANTTLSNNDKILSYNIDETMAPYSPNPGRIAFANLPILIDNTVVKSGDELEIELSGADITKQTLIVAKFGEYFIDCSVKSVNRIGESSGSIDTIALIEEKPGLFSPGTIIDFVLPNGIEWEDEANIDNSISVVGSGGLRGTGNTGAVRNLPGSITDESYIVSLPTPNNLRITFSDSFTPTTNTVGRINIGDEENNAYAKIKCLNQVRPVNVTVQANSPNNKHIKEQYITVAQFVEEKLVNANLSDLQVSGLTVTEFSPDILNYYVDVPLATQDIPEVTATAANPNASITIYQARNLDGTESERTATVLVQSEDNTVTKTYKVVFTRSDAEQPPGTSDCFIATAAFGSYLDPHVHILREFRDNILLTSSIGTYFVNQYYQYSPPLAEVIAKYSFLKAIVRFILTPIIFTIQYPESFIFLLLIVTVYVLKKHTLKLQSD